MLFENENEDWKDVPNYPNYMISSLGRLYNKTRDKCMNPDSHGSITLYNDDGHKAWSVQVLMGCAFLGNDINDPCRNRILFRDGNSQNRVLNNLYIEDTSDLPGEEWKPLKYAANRALKDFYQVSNKGRVKSLKHFVEVKNYSKIVSKPCPELIITCTTDADGYKFAFLACADGSEINAQVHRLVASAFCTNPDPEIKNVVNHIDGNPSNNNAENLEWCTQQENSQHAIRTGLRGNWKGRNLRYPVLRLETNQFFNSISDVDKAMGRCSGYCAEALSHGNKLTDKDGNIWTLEIFKDLKRKVHSGGQHCTIDEIPGKEFVSLGEASLAIGRWEGYISECIKNNFPVKNKAGQVVHVNTIGEAFIVPANTSREEKKKAGLLPPAKERKSLSMGNMRQSLKHIETGTIYLSMSAASRAMNKDASYVSECFAWNRECFDSDGNKWTFEILDCESATLHYKKNPCYFEEIPEKEFANYTEASLAIGREGGYVSDRLHASKPIISKDGQELHIHKVS